MLKVKVDGKKERVITFSDSTLKTGQVDGLDFHIDLSELKKGRFHLIKNNRSYSAEILKTIPEEKTVVILVNGNKYTVRVFDKYDELLKSLGFEGSGKGKINSVNAPMPGLVLDVMVNEGATVKKGDPVLVLEAMKMENILKSPSDGTIKKINIKKGAAVEKNQVLLTFA